MNKKIKFIWIILINIALGALTGFGYFWLLVLLHANVLFAVFYSMLIAAATGIALTLNY